MPFVRGMQWKGGRLVPGRVDKRSIRRGTKNARNLFFGCLAVCTNMPRIYKYNSKCSPKFDPFPAIL